MFGQSWLKKINSKSVIFHKSMRISAHTIWWERIEILFLDSRSIFQDDRVRIHVHWRKGARDIVLTHGLDRTPQTLTTPIIFGMCWRRFFSTRAWRDLDVGTLHKLLKNYVTIYASHNRSRISVCELFYFLATQWIWSTAVFVWKV